MKKFLFLVVFLQSYLLACATCQFMIPTAEVNLNLIVEDKKIEKIEVQWYFSDMYTSELTMQYDKNKNHILDKNELDTILKIKVDYLKPKNMLTLLKYGNNDKENIINTTSDNFKVKVIDDRLLFSFEMYAEIEIKEDYVLSFLFEDDESFFSFIVHDLKISSKDIFYTENLYLFTAAVLFSFEPFLEQKEPLAKNIETNNTEITPSKEPSTQESLLEETIEKLKSLFKEVEETQNIFTYLLILLFAYIYGVIHAIGPGHGKTLVASYFLSNDRSYSKALFISLAIGIVHTFSAFLLTVVIYFIINTFLAQFMDNTIMITTKVSAFIIIAIALYLLYKKLQAYSNSKKPLTFTTSPHISSCGCGSCKVDKNSTDAALVISAGIIPCPGTVTVFIFSLSMGLYFLGFLSAFVMSIGMSTIIFISALISVSVRKKALKKHSKIQLILEYLSLALIFILGVILFFSVS